MARTLEQRLHEIATLRDDPRTPAAAKALVERFMNEGDDATAEAAVLALGESRLEAAHPALARWCENTFGDELQRVGYLALALLRVEAATAYLLDVVRTAAPQRARHAVAALATFRADPALAARVRAAAENADASVRREVRESF